MVRPSIKLLAIATAFLTLLPLLGLVDIEMQQRCIAGRNVSGERYYLPPPAVLRALAFGYNEVAADLLWIRTIAYFTDHLVSDRDYSNLEHYIESILALDDSFDEVYRYGSSMFTSRGEHQTNEDVQAAIALLERGHERFPNYWKFPFTIGAYYISELRTKDQALRERWRRQGADWIRRAALLGADIAWLPALAASIYSEQGQRKLAIKHLEELYLTTQSPETRHQIMAKLRHLHAAHDATQLRQQAEQFARRYRSSPISFVPPDLFLLVDLPPLEPFSLDGAGPSNADQ